MKVLLIGGQGKWGSVIAENLQHFPVKVVVPTRKNWKKELETDSYHAAIVSTAPTNHAEILEICAQHNIYVFLEKPVLNYCLNQVPENKILVNHQHLFSPYFQQAAQAWAQTSDPAEIYSVGPTTRSTCSHLWDYGSHTIAMLSYLYLLQGRKLDLLNYRKCQNYWSYTDERGKVNNLYFGLSDIKKVGLYQNTINYDGLAQRDLTNQPLYCSLQHFFQVMEERITPGIAWGWTIPSMVAEFLIKIQAF